MLQVQRIANFLSLDILGARWNELCHDQPFRRFEWLGSWAETYVRDGELYVLEARDNGNLVGLMPLFRDNSASQGRVLRWAGSGEVCTDYLGIMARQEDRSSVVSAFAGWLVEASRIREHGWDVLQLDAVDNEEESVVELQQCLGELGCTFHDEPGMNCWRIQLPETWDEYLARMSKSHRKQIKRAERRFGGDLSTEILSVADERSFARGMEVLVQLHQKRRIRLGEPGCFASKRFSTFLHTAALRLLSSGLLRLTWAEVAGEPIACEFQLAGGSMTYAYQAGVDPDRMELEPGRVIMIATIKDAIARGHTAFDFLRGDEPYKAHWRATPRATKNIRIVAPTTGSQLRHGIWLAGSSFKGFVKSKVSFSGS